MTKKNHLLTEAQIQEVGDIIQEMLPKEYTDKIINVLPIFLTQCIILSWSCVIVLL